MHWLLLLAVYLLFLPPYSPVDPAATADYTAAGYDYVDDDRTPTVELPGKQPFPSPTYRLLICIYLLHYAYAAATILPIQLHSYSLSPLDYLSVIPMQPIN